MPSPDSLTTAAHRDLDLILEHGTWPDDISGEVFFSAPIISGGAPFGLFDAGCVIRLSLQPGSHSAASDRFAWRTRLIETPGQLLRNTNPDWFSANTVGFRSAFGPLNAANTAPLPWGDRLFATWDAGRPVELDPITLDFVGEVGDIDSWGGSAPFPDTVLPTMLTTAHPVVDPDRNGMWMVKLEPAIGEAFELVPWVIWWDPESTRVERWPLDGIKFRGSTHTISQTRDWLIVSDSGNFRADMGEILGGERTVRVDTDAPVWLIRKDALLATEPLTPYAPVVSRVSPPSGHYYAVYDDSAGISVIWEGMDMLDLALFIRPDDVDLMGRPMNPANVGLYNMAMAPSTLTEIVFDPTSGAVSHRATVREDWSMNLQLSAMDWSIAGISAPQLHHVAYQGCLPDRITERAARFYEDRIDRSTLESQTPGALVSFERGGLKVRSRWDHVDPGDMITSPTFVPRNAASAGIPGGSDGYVVLPVLSDNGFRVEVFDAARVGDGPVATLRTADRSCVPLLLHSAWMPSVDALVDAPRVRFADEITEGRLASLDDTQRDAVAMVAATLG